MAQREFKKNEDFFSKTRAAISSIEESVEKMLHAPSISADEYDIALHQLFGVLPVLFRFMDRENPLRSAAIDDFELQTVSDTKKKVHFKGRCYWLGGRRGADEFLIDYAKNTRPKLYSFKFRSIENVEPTDLYVGKTFTGWEIGNA